MRHETIRLSLSLLFICSAGLSLMPSSALVELLHRVEATIREYSEELVGQLARREELEFEKEVKNTFITALMEVQNRQKEQRDGKRRRREKTLSLQGGTLNGVNMGSTEKNGGMPVKVGISLITEDRGFYMLSQQVRTFTKALQFYQAFCTLFLWRVTSHFQPLLRIWSNNRF